MFYTDAYEIPYPSRSILEDVLSRERGDYENSTTGLPGCRDILRGQLGDKAGDYPLETILQNLDDYNAEKQKPDDSEVGSTAMSERDDYYTRLEDIPEDYIRKYVTNALIGFKLRDDGLRSLKNNSLAAAYLEDNDEDKFFIETDLEETVKDVSPEKLLEAKKMLPYHLKVLADGSKEHGGHLLSFIIASLRINDKGYNWAPRFFVSMGVYSVNPETGAISSEFVIDDNKRVENNGYGFRRCYQWIKGEINDIYYKSYKELLGIAEILGIDLKREDPRDYDIGVVEKATCLYIAKNEEFINGIGRADRSILDLIEDGRIFKAMKSLKVDKEPAGQPNKFGVMQAIERVVRAYAIKNQQVQCAKVVQSFLVEYRKKAAVEVEVALNAYSIDTGVLCRNNLPVTFKLSLFVNQCGQNDSGVLTPYGEIIKIEWNFIENHRLRFVRAEEAIRALKYGTMLEMEERFDF